MFGLRGSKQAQEQLKEQLKEVRARVRRRDQEIVKLRERVAFLEGALGETKTSLSEASAEIDAFKAQLVTRGERLRAMGPELGEREQEIIDRFSRLYYDLGSAGGTWQRTAWLGAPVQKVPLDLWIYQEILYEQQPDLIIETGTADGGSALYLASVCDLLEKGRIVTVDIAERGPSGTERPSHPRVRYLLGSSTDEKILEDVRREAEGAERVLIILDSDHSEGHVLAELEAYSDLVPLGGYLIVEDTNINGHPVLPGFGPGPMEALDAFLSRTNSFEIDESCEKLLLTQNPRGYLKRVR